jgi:hypothetical protein
MAAMQAQNRPPTRRAKIAVERRRVFLSYDRDRGIGEGGDVRRSLDHGLQPDAFSQGGRGDGAPFVTGREPDLYPQRHDLNDFAADSSLPRHPRDERALLVEGDQPR